jgi:hypothetical protein
VRSTADNVASDMSALGYERYVVPARDVGSEVAETLAAARLDRIMALHLTDVTTSHALETDPDGLSTEDQRPRRAHQWVADEGSYVPNSRRPHTLAVGLGDSPAVLAAWIEESVPGLVSRSSTPRQPRDKTSGRFGRVA